MCGAVCGGFFFTCGGGIDLFKKKKKKIECLRPKKKAFETRKQNTLFSKEKTKKKTRERQNTCSMNRHDNLSEPCEQRLAELKG
jgi:hypothetical protein